MSNYSYDLSERSLSFNRKVSFQEDWDENDEDASYVIKTLKDLDRRLTELLKKMKQKRAERLEKPSDSYKMLVDEEYLANIREEIQNEMVETYIDELESDTADSIEIEETAWRLIEEVKKGVIEAEQSIAGKTTILKDYYISELQKELRRFIEAIKSVEWARYITGTQSVEWARYIFGKCKDTSMAGTSRDRQVPKLDTVVKKRNVLSRSRNIKNFINKYIQPKPSNKTKPVEVENKEPVDKPTEMQNALSVAKLDVLSDELVKWLTPTNSRLSPDWWDVQSTCYSITSSQDTGNAAKQASQVDNNDEPKAQEISAVSSTKVATDKHKSILKNSSKTIVVKAHSEDCAESKIVDSASFVIQKSEKESVSANDGQMLLNIQASMLSHASLHCPIVLPRVSGYSTYDLVPSFEIFRTRTSSEIAKIASKEISRNNAMIYDDETDRQQKDRNKLIASPEDSKMRRIGSKASHKLKCILQSSVTKASQSSDSKHKGILKKASRTEEQSDTAEDHKDTDYCKPNESSEFNLSDTYTLQFDKETISNEQQSFYSYVSGTASMVSNVTGQSADVKPSLDTLGSKNSELTMLAVKEALDKFNESKSLNNENEPEKEDCESLNMNSEVSQNTKISAENLQKDMLKTSEPETTETTEEFKNIEQFRTSTQKSDVSTRRSQLVIDLLNSQSVVKGTFAYDEQILNKPDLAASISTDTSHTQSTTHTVGYSMPDKKSSSMFKVKPTSKTTKITTEGKHVLIHSTESSDNEIDGYEEGRARKIPTNRKGSKSSAKKSAIPSRAKSVILSTPKVPECKQKGILKNASRTESNPRSETSEELKNEFYPSPKYDVFESESALAYDGKMILNTQSSFFTHFSGTPSVVSRVLGYSGYDLLTPSFGSMIRARSSSEITQDGSDDFIDDMNQFFNDRSVRRDQDIQLTIGRIGEEKPSRKHSRAERLKSLVSLPKVSPSVDGKQKGILKKTSKTIVKMEQSVNYIQIKNIDSFKTAVQKSTALTKLNILEETSVLDEKESFNREPSIFSGSSAFPSIFSNVFSYDCDFEQVFVPTLEMLKTKTVSELKEATFIQEPITQSCSRFSTNLESWMEMARAKLARLKDDDETSDSKSLVKNRKNSSLPQGITLSPKESVKKVRPLKRRNFMYIEEDIHECQTDFPYDPDESLNSRPKGLKRIFHFLKRSSRRKKRDKSEWQFIIQ